jgi:hypothetical protein
MYFIESQNICKRWRYIVRSIDNNNVEHLTMIFKNRINIAIYNNVFGEKAYIIPVHSIALNSKSAIMTVYNFMYMK